MSDKSASTWKCRICNDTGKVPVNTPVPGRINYAGTKRCQCQWLKDMANIEDKETVSVGGLVAEQASVTEAGLDEIEAKVKQQYCYQGKVGLSKSFLADDSVYEYQRLSAALTDSCRLIAALRQAQRQNADMRALLSGFVSFLKKNGWTDAALILKERLTTGDLSDSAGRGEE